MIAASQARVRFTPAELWFTNPSPGRAEFFIHWIMATERADVEMSAGSSVVTGISTAVWSSNIMVFYLSLLSERGPCRSTGSPGTAIIGVLLSAREKQESQSPGNGPERNPKHRVLDRLSEIPGGKVGGDFREIR